MKKFLFTLIPLFFIATLFFSCAGSSGYSSSSDDGLTLNITTSKSRAALCTDYEFTVSLKGSSYSKKETKKGNPVSFYFSDVPVGQNIDINVTVKLDSVLIYTGSKTTVIQEGDNEVTIDLANQLEDTIVIKYDQIDNLGVILGKTSATTPTLVITGGLPDAETFRGKLNKQVNVNLLNVSGTLSQSYITTLCQSSRVSSAIIGSGNTLQIESTSNLPTQLSGSGATVQLTGNSIPNNYASIMANVRSSNLTNVTLDFNNTLTDIPALNASSPTNVTSLILTGVTTIGQDAFKLWEGLSDATVTIPSSVTHICCHSFDVVYDSYVGNIVLNYQTTTGWHTDNGINYTYPPTANDIVSYGFLRN